MCLTLELVTWVLAVPHPCVVLEAGMLFLVGGSILASTVGYRIIYYMEYIIPAWRFHLCVYRLL